VASLKKKAFKFELLNPRPNPFTNISTICYSIPGQEGTAPVHTTLIIYDLAGRKVCTLVNDKLLPGNYMAKWDGKSDHGGSLPSGLYFLRLHSGNQVMTRTLLLFSAF
jgi:flagellar hook assembly protein FlgD